MLMPKMDDVAADVSGDRMFCRRNFFKAFLRRLKNRRFVEAKMHLRHGPKVKLNILNRNERALDALGFQKTPKTWGF